MTETIEHARRLSKAMPVWVEPQPLVCVGKLDGKLAYENDVMDVIVETHDAGSPFDGGPWVRIGVSWSDGGFNHDWRTLQWVKNQIVGQEWEALELYPAESRLVDPSNYFILWAYPKIPIGMQGVRRVVSPDVAVAPQRGHKTPPPDLITHFNWWKKSEL